MGNPQSLSIRDAASDETEAILALTLAAYAQYAPLVPPELWDAYRANIIATVTAPEPVERIVAERSGTLVGSVLLYPAQAAAYASYADAPTWPEIRLLAVIPAVRGQGVATALMAECLRRVSLAGAQAIGLHTMDMMEVAARMYERMGFVREPSTDFSPAEGVVVKGYRLELPPPSR